MVNARPPAIIEPALMAAWQTLASCRFLDPSARSASTLTMAAKAMGHGSMPMRRAMKSELAVRTAEPTAPMMTARRVSAGCSTCWVFSAIRCSLCRTWGSIAIRSVPV